MKRLESSQWFADEVIKLRSTRKMSPDVIRCIEAFILFSRSVLDCVAFLLYDICELDVNPEKAYIRKVAAKAASDPKWADLQPVLLSLVKSPRFKHLDGLRNVVTHKTILYTAIEHTVGADNDRLLIPSDPHDLVASCLESGIDISEYVREVMQDLASFVEEVADILIAYVRNGHVNVYGTG